VLAMLATGVRSGALAANSPERKTSVCRDKRTDANGCERLSRFDKLGVTGSSPVPPTSQRPRLSGFVVVPVLTLALTPYLFAVAWYCRREVESVRRSPHESSWSVR
jgi:hypothetical protein